MPSPIDSELPRAVQQEAAKRRPRDWGEIIEVWNSKLHYYSGLFLLLFIWMFSFTGLVLNHRWGFSNFWPSRVESTFTRQVQPSRAMTGVAQAEDFMRQLDLRGEVAMKDSPSQPDRFDFRAVKPGLLMDIGVDLRTSQATVRQIRVNKWGIAQMLHTFDVEKRNGSSARRNWLLSEIWCFTMDAVALGLIFMVLSGYYMWFRFKRIYLGGGIALALGVAVCGFFVIGLNWLHPLP